MAWQVSKRVWDHAKEIKESFKVMLLALADKADEQGICWPKYDTSYETLSQMVGVNRRSAMRLIDSLCEKGHIIKTETVGRGNSNTFVVISGLSEAEIKERLARIGVTDDTITKEEKVLSETPKEEEMVLPVTQNGVVDDTIKPVNGVTDNTQSNKENPTQNPISSKDDSGKPPNSSEQKKLLEPDTPETELLFEKINLNRQAEGRGPAKRFKSVQQKDKCLKAAARLGYDSFAAGVDIAMGNGVVDRDHLVNWIAKYQNGANNNGTYRNATQQPSGQDNQKRGRFTDPEQGPDWDPFGPDPG